MPTLKFATPAQANRFAALQAQQAYFTRVVKEIAAPIIDGHKRANLAMDTALSEIGVPTDTRDVRLLVETGEIFYEDEDWVWSDKDGKAVERDAESKAAWVAKRAKAC